VQLGFVEILIGVAELAIALAGFTGIVVVLGSRDDGGWHPGDRLRLGFLIESSLTAAGFSLLALLLLYLLPENPGTAWITVSSLWSAFMLWSLYFSHLKIKRDLQKHDDIDRFANGIVTAIFISLIGVQLANVFLWADFAPLLAALCFNLAGAAMQFARLVRSAYHDNPG